jgi:amino acid permease
MENKITNPSDMTGYVGVLSTGMSLVTIVYAACGFYGYQAYGVDTKGTITLNLPDTP